MAIFSPNVQTNTVTNSATKVFDTTSSLFTTGATLADVTVENTSTSTTVFLGQSGVTSSTGLRLEPGDQITYQGYSHVKGDTTGDIYAITASGTAVVVTGLATVNTVD